MFAGRLSTPWLFCLAALLIAVPFAWFSDVPERDVASRYASMAEAFAAGSWTYAFHPRIPALFPAVCGVLVRIFGISGFSAAKIVSVACFVATVFPLFGIMRRFFGDRIAAGSLLVYIVNPFLLRLSSTGLRETMKCMFLVMIVHAVLLIRDKPGSPACYLYLGACAGCAMITRSEMILFCGLVLFGMMVRETLERLKLRRGPAEADANADAGTKVLPLPMCTLAGTLLTAGFVFIPAIINRAVFGIPTPEVRFLDLFEIVFGRAPSLADAAVIAVLAPFAMAAAALELGAVFSGKRLKPFLIVVSCVVAAAYVAIFVWQMLRYGYRPESVKEFLFSFERAFDPLWTIPAVIGLAVRIRGHKYTAGESLLLWFILIHTVIVTGQVMLFDRTLTISVRYMLPVTPLGFGWSFCGIAVVAGLFGRYIPHVTERTALSVLLAAYVTGALFHCFGPILKDYFEPRHKVVRLGTLRLAAYLRAKRPVRSRAVPPSVDLMNYEGCAAPGVLFERTSKHCVSAYLAGGRSVRNPEHADFYVAGPGLPDELSTPPGEGWNPVPEELIPMGRERICLVFRREESAQ